MRALEEYLYDLNIPVPMFRDIVAAIAVISISFVVWYFAACAEISFTIGRMV